MAVKYLKPFICTFCRIKHHSLYKFKKHVNRHLIKYMCVLGCKQCVGCNKDLSQSRELQGHLNNHSKLWYHRENCLKIPKPHQCGNCQKCFAMKYTFWNHIRTCSQGKLYQCGYCLKNFTRNSSLKRHINIHTEETPSPHVPDHYPIHVYFVKKGELVCEIRIPTKEKPYQCGFCQRCFTRRDTLLNHMLKQLCKKRSPLYQCKYCQKCCTKKDALVKHLRIHTKEKPYQCEYCQKSFSRNTTLLNHIRARTCRRVKPEYQCEYCQKCFARNSRFKEHMKMHTKEKPFQCEICMKCFSVNRALKAHISIHKKNKTIPV